MTVFFLRGRGRTRLRPLTERFTVELEHSLRLSPRRLSLSSRVSLSSSGVAATSIPRLKLVRSPLAVTREEVVWLWRTRESSERADPSSWPPRSLCNPAGRFNDFKMISRMH